MDDAPFQEALREAQRLSQLSDEALYEELGLRINDMQNLGGYERSKHYSAAFRQEAPDMLGIADLWKVGERWWKKLEPALMNLVCEKNNKDLQQITSGKTIPQIAASLATAAAVSLLAPPAWIIVATAILATKISETGLDALCEVWHESLQVNKPGH